MAVISFWDARRSRFYSEAQLHELKKILEEIAEGRPDTIEIIIKFSSDGAIDAGIRPHLSCECPQVIHNLREELHAVMSDFSQRVFKSVSIH
jgi:hypothetical protein